MLKKIEQYVLWFLLFAIPFQARTIVYSPNWSFNEYTSFTVYGTDILITGLLLLWLFSKKNGVSYRFREDWIALGIFITVALLSVWHAFDFSIGVYRLFKLIEMIALFAYVRYRAQAVLSLQAMLMALVTGGMFQAVAGIVQFFKQSDIGLRILGESILHPDMRGVAVFYNTAGEKVMRAYGITPHPNIVASYLLLALGALYSLYAVGRERIKPWLWHVCYAIILFAFFLTFSRVVILAWVMMTGTIVLTLLAKETRTILAWKGAAIATVIMSVLFSIVFWNSIVGRLTINSADEGLVLRKYYNEQALESHTALNFGIGIGNFVPWLMDRNPGLPQHLFQPAHNMYLLMYAEIGLLGVLAFLAWLMITIKQFWQTTQRGLPEIISLSMFLGLAFVGLFDHFLWTLQQGMLMWWVMAGMIASSYKSANL
ncbi:MAG: O-antigen ligase family protein [Candidatus Uhrbacteria bacterium]|nr:O-antigen ligase family protein [Candidatus Uhrbacteria bacterium]